jgi:hypothetical protein
LGENAVRMLALAVAALFASVSISHAQNINCTGTVGGGATVTTVNGNVTVPGGASCTLQFVNVTGNVQVQRLGSLVITAYDEPSTIGGKVEAGNCVSTLLEGNVTVKGDLQIVSCTGTRRTAFKAPAS